MIRQFIKNDLTAVMKIWLDTNMTAHHFISKEYWSSHYAMVKEMLPQAELYVYEDDKTHQIVGFIGLIHDYIAGIFVKEIVQSNGIGQQLLNYAKELKPNMRLNVYQKNTRAISFYQREQFVIQSETIDDTTHEKELIMVWHK